jgi:hypothetical protein
MKARFQADADLNEDIVMALIRREPGIDFQTAEEAGLRGHLMFPLAASGPADSGGANVERFNLELASCNSQ